MHYTCIKCIWLNHKAAGSLWNIPNVMNQISYKSKSITWRINIIIALHNFFTVSSTNKDDATGDHHIWFKAIARFNSPEKTLEINLTNIGEKVIKYGENVFLPSPIIFLSRSADWFSHESHYWCVIRRRRAPRRSLEHPRDERTPNSTWCWHRIFLQGNASRTIERKYNFVMSYWIELGRRDSVCAD